MENILKSSYTLKFQYKNIEKDILIQNPIKMIKKLESYFI